MIYSPLPDKIYTTFQVVYCFYGNLLRVYFLAISLTLVIIAFKSKNLLRNLLRVDCFLLGSAGFQFLQNRSTVHFLRSIEFG